MKKFIPILLCVLLSASLNASELKPLTRKLNGTDITYNYTSGRSYNVKFEEAGVSYRLVPATIK